MPRTPPARPQPPVDTGKQLERVNAVVASAAQLGAKNMVRPRTTGATDWQNEAWYFYDTVGEFRFGVNWKAHALSQCELVIQELDDKGEWVRITSGPEVDALGMLFEGDGGQSQALHTMTLHFEVPGETYLVGELMDDDGRPDPNGTDTWTVYSNEELTPKDAGSPTSAATWQIDRGDGRKRVISEDTAWVIRLWDSHPRKWVEADSPARAALPILREIEQLTKGINAALDSRLAGAGILLMPTEMTFSGVATALTGTVQTEGEADPPGAPTVTQDDANKFLRDLMLAMVTPIANRDHPAAVVPVIVKAPGALLANIKHITFDTPLDKKALEARKDGVGRLALTADMPAEILQGIGDVNHWSAWQLEESAIKIHIEPLGEKITSGLTQRWLKLAVKALGAVPNPRRRVGLDTAKLRLRPDRTAEAQWAYEHLLIGGDSLLREIGLAGADAPTPDEIREALIKRLATQAGATPEMVVAAIMAMMQGATTINPDDVPAPMEPPAIEQGGGTDTPADQPPAQSPPEDTGPPSPTAPPPASGAEVAVLAAGMLLSKRAVERARNRARQRGKRSGPPTGEQLAADLGGAWDDVPETAAMLGIDPVWFTTRLDTYARAVLTTGEAHKVDVLRRVLGSA